MTSLRALIVGLGSVGRRHARALRQVAPDARIVAWRRAPGPGSEGVDAVVGSLEEALATRPQVAVVCTPAPMHVELALPLAERGVHLLVEKPLSDRLDEADRLLAATARAGVVLQVGYVLRFHEPLRRLREALAAGEVGRALTGRFECGQHLAQWRPGVDPRASVSARADQGGGALLELSHELDALRWLLGEPRTLCAASARAGDLAQDVEDLAEVVLRLEGGALASLHVDMLDRAGGRRYRVVGERGTLEWRSEDDRLRLFAAEAGGWRDLCPPRAPERDLAFRAQLTHFLGCARGAARPEVSGQDGRRALELALAARGAAAERRWVEVAPRGAP